MNKATLPIFSAEFIDRLLGKEDWKRVHRLILALLLYHTLGPTATESNPLAHRIYQGICEIWLGTLLPLWIRPTVEREWLVISVWGTTGHVTTSLGDPNTFVSASTDGYARLYDFRHPCPVLTFDVEQSYHSSILPLMPILTVFLMTLFTGRAKTENVGVWDIRPRKLVYDLSTDSGVSYGYRDAETPVSFETVTETRAGILPGQREIFMTNSFTGRCMMLAQQSLLRYSFKPDANTAFVQKYGNASPDSGRSYASW
ncbi:hypothetical protein C8Q75DRAFT_806502 [Abortiporus biennis]|nr:hypothetical protein C8Q75DRAFT_806502 [Abortiporus biennis]